MQWMGENSPLDVMFVLTILLYVFNFHVSEIFERTLVCKTISPKTQGSSARQGRDGRAADVSSNEQKRMDLGIDY